VGPVTVTHKVEHILYKYLPAKLMAVKGVVIFRWMWCMCTL